MLFFNWSWNVQNYEMNLSQESNWNIKKNCNSTFEHCKSLKTNWFANLSWIQPAHDHTKKSHKMSINFESQFYSWKSENFLYSKSPTFVIKKKNFKKFPSFWEVKMLSIIMFCILINEKLTLHRTCNILRMLRNHIQRTEDRRERKKTIAMH